MDSNLLSQLLFKAKKSDNLVKLYPVSGNDLDYCIIDPSNAEWDIKSDSLITDNIIIDLNSVISAVIIDKIDYKLSIERKRKLEHKIQDSGVKL